MAFKYQVEKLPHTKVSLGECPFWNSAVNCLFYVDLTEGKLCRYDGKYNEVHKAKIQGEKLVGFAVPIQGSPNAYIAGCGRRLLILKWDGKSEKCKVERTYHEVQPEEKYKDNRFNDGKCDPEGRLFAGTMVYADDKCPYIYRLGELYRFDANRKQDLIQTDVGISNGLAWNWKARKFYFVDTAEYNVREYDYDIQRGLVFNPVVVFCLKDQKLWPDGLTIDTEGNLYVAIKNGGCIYKVDPRTGEILLKIDIPCTQVTSCIFGGPNLDSLYVTTASDGDSNPEAGFVYKVTGLCAKGFPYVKFRMPTEVIET